MSARTRAPGRLSVTRFTVGREDRNKGGPGTSQLAPLSSLLAEGQRPDTSRFTVGQKVEKEREERAERLFPELVIEDAA